MFEALHPCQTIQHAVEFCTCVYPHSHGTLFGFGYQPKSRVPVLRTPNPFWISKSTWPKITCPSLGTWNNVWFPNRCNCLQNVCRNKRNCQTECSVSFVSPWKHVSSRSHFCFKCHFSIPGFCPTLLSLPVLIKNFGIQTCTAFPWFALMQAQDIVNFSGLRIHCIGLHGYTWSWTTYHAVRVHRWCSPSPFLQACGEPKFLQSAFNLWASMSNSLVLVERLYFPEQPLETNTSLVLPPRPRSCRSCYNPNRLG